MSEAQVKGTALVDLARLAQQHLAAFESLLVPATRGLLHQRLLPSSWYPERALRDLLVAADKLRGRGDLGSCIQLGRTLAQKDLAGVYRSLLIPGDPGATLANFPGAWSLYHDTGVVEVEALGELQVRLTIRGHGLPSRPLCLLTLGWLEEAVARAGAASPQAVEDACREQGGTFCVYRVSWAPPGS